MTTIIITKKRIGRLKNPLFLEGMPGVGNVGRIAAGYIVEKLNGEKFAELYSSFFQHVTLIHANGTIHVIKGEFYVIKRKKSNGLKRDLIIYLGDQQSETSQGTYEIVWEILKFIKKLGVKEMITMGGLKVDRPVKEPKVYGAASDNEVIKKFKNYEIDFNSSGKVGSIVGAVGLLVGLGKLYGIKGVTLLVESFGPPILPDHRGAKKLLEILKEILKFKLDLKEIEKKVKEQEALRRKLSATFTPQPLPKREEETKKTDISYIR